jgi:hypothetical protein
MPQQRKQPASAGKKAASKARSASSAARKPTRKAASATRSAAESSGKAIAELTKPELVERMTTQLNKLKKEDLAGLLERLEAGDLDLSRFAVTGEGGFGFQGHVRDERSGEGSGDGNGGDKGLIPRAGEALRGAAEKIGEKI